RSVAESKKLRINTFEKVMNIKKVDQKVQLTTTNASQKTHTYQANNVIIATGYYDQPNYINVPGEELDKVMHYFKEAHPYYNKDIVIIGGKNSADRKSTRLNSSHVSISYAVF